MRKTIAAPLLGISSLLCAGAAQAQVVAYDFSAVIETVAEGRLGDRDPAKVAASTRNGSLVATGGTISGRFYLDLSTPFGNWEPLEHENTGGAANYRAGFGIPTNAGTSVRFDGSGYRFDSVPQWYTGIQVLDKPAGGGRDLFALWGVGGSDSGAGPYQSNSVNLWDGRAMALSSFAIPATLELADWSDPYYSYYWQSADGEQALWVHARITGLAPASPVPEPATFAMMALGIALIGSRYRSANFTVDRVGIEGAGAKPGAASAS